jgi:hypothetical protein
LFSSSHCLTFFFRFEIFEIEDKQNNTKQQNIDIVIIYINYFSDSIYLLIKKVLRLSQITFLCPYMSSTRHLYIKPECCQLFRISTEYEVFVSPSLYFQILKMATYRDCFRRSSGDNS